MADIAGIQMDLEDALEQAEQWLKASGALLPPGDSGYDTLADDHKRIEALRTRAGSVLLNVAMLGGFSSGKSFLLSGIQGGLSVEMHGGARKYIGLLPSDTRPTSSCPATVEPVVAARTERDCSGRGFLRVRFSHSNDWVDIRPSPSPATVASYATSPRADAPSGRLDEHRSYSVDEIQLLVSSFKVHAKLYDLPGHGSTNKVHDGIVRARMHDADCFLYVATSTRTLDDSDLELIRFLYQHHKQTGKRVLWVVTAIDKALDLGMDNKPAWKATVEENNRFLEEHFQLPNGRPDAGFIGLGFQPVSPALEAQGLLARDPDGGHYDPAEGAELISESHMEDLRNELRQLIDQGSGLRHIRTIASEARAILRPRCRTLVREREENLVPHRNLRESLETTQQFQQEINSALEQLSSELERMLDERVKAATEPFERRGSLAAHLHGALDRMIREGNIRKPSVEHQIEVRRIQETRDWMTAPTGPAARWDVQFDEFTTDVLRLLDQHLRDDVLTTDLGRLRSLDVDDLIVPRTTHRRRGRGGGVLARVAAVSGTAGAMGGAATAFGFASGGALIPAGVVILGGMTLFEAISYRRARGSSLDLQRQELIDHLDQTAQQARELFTATASAVGRDVIDNAVDILTTRRNEVRERATRLRQRLAAPENLDRQARIDQLEPLCSGGQEVLAKLTALAR